MTLTMRDIQHSLVLYTAPTVEPLTASDARAHCRIDDTNEDAYLEGLIKAARRYCERVTDRALISQTWKLYLDAFVSEIELRVCPVISVTGITYIDTAGATQTLATSYYQLLTGEPGLITPKYNQSYPSLRGDDQGVVVTFTAGYGTSAADVPETFKHAMRLLIAHWYRNRESADVDPPQAIAQAVDSLLWSEKWGAYS